MRPKAFRRRWGRFAADARAVSPVIGTILVLFIVVLAMGGILAWGVPAIEGLEDHADYQSMVTQMVQLNADMRALRDPQNTRQVTISMNQGELKVTTGSRWVFTAAASDAYRPLNLTNWELNAATPLGLSLSPWPGGTLNVTVERAQGGTFTRVGQRDCTSSPCSVSLTTSYRFPANTTRVQIKSAGVLQAESWIFEAGRVTYASGDRRIHLEMGAVFTDQAGRTFLEEKPSFKPPAYDTAPKDTNWIARVFEITGDTGAGGKGRHTVVANLVDNYGATRGRPTLPNIKTVRLQIDDSDHGGLGRTGMLEEAFCNHLRGQGNYSVHGAPGPSGDRCAGGDVNLLFDPAPDNAYTNNGRFTFELSQATVKVIIRAF